MSAETKNDGVIRIGRKGLRTFAFGDDKPFTVDVVVQMQQWIIIDDAFRPVTPNENGEHPIPKAEMPAFHEAGRQFVMGIAKTGEEPAPDLTVTEAFEFLAELRNAYNEMLDFFVPKSSHKPEPPGTTAVPSGLEFGVETQTPP